MTNRGREDMRDGPAQMNSILLDFNVTAFNFVLHLVHFRTLVVGHKKLNKHLP